MFVIGDLHLGFSTEKPMDKFGDAWKNHFAKIKEDWLEKVGDEDVVLLAGDSSWSMRYDDARVDFEWIDRLPGKKLLIKGNHDYWWSFRSRLAKEFSSLFFINSNCYVHGRYAVVGSRGWDFPASEDGEDARIYAREAVRLENALKSVPRNKVIIGMMHYPPSIAGESTAITNLFSEYGAMKVYYGHLHGASCFERAFEGVIDGVEYRLISCDYTGFRLVEIPVGSLLDTDDTDFKTASELLEKRRLGICLLSGELQALPWHCLCWGVSGRGYSSAGSALHMMSGHRFDKPAFIEYNYELAKQAAASFVDSESASADAGAESRSSEWGSEMGFLMPDGQSPIDFDVFRRIFRIASQSVRSVADGLIKYHMLNALAKKMMLEADVYEFSNLKKHLEMREIAHSLYRKKDAVTGALISKLLEKEDALRVYPISMRSEAMSGKMYEISAIPSEKIVLHTMDAEIIENCKSAGVEIGEIRKSAISAYVDARIL